MEALNMRQFVALIVFFLGVKTSDAQMATFPMLMPDVQPVQVSSTLELRCQLTAAVKMSGILVREISTYINCVTPYDGNSETYVKN